MKSEREYCDKQTVRKNSIPLTFLIYYERELVLTLTIDSESTVEGMLNSIRVRLNSRFQNIIGLATVNGHEIIDFTLTLKDYPIGNYHNSEQFTLLLEECVRDFYTPSLDDFTFLKFIGEGVSANVYLVRHKNNAKLYALKQIKKEYFQDFKKLQQVLREKKIMTEQLADLPFVTKLYASFQSQKHLNFLLEYYPGGQLFFHLQNKKFTEEEVKICFAQIVLTFEQLHRRKMIYRDLKPQNIMIDFDGHLRLGDFGLCKINVQKQDLSYTYCGSLQYMPPQTKTSVGYSFTADFYTMGALIYQMMRGVPPYYQGSPLDFPQGLSQDFIEIVTKLIDNDPLKRLNDFESLKAMKWMNNVQWEKVQRKKIKMPLKVLPYKNYTHEQFRVKTLDDQKLREEERYDHLFDMFYYLSKEKNGIAMYYPAGVKEEKVMKKMLKKSNNASKMVTSNHSVSKNKSSYKKESSPKHKKNNNSRESSTNMSIKKEGKINIASKNAYNIYTAPKVSPLASPKHSVLKSLSALKFNKLIGLKSSKEFMRGKNLLKSNVSSQKRGKVLRKN